MPWKPETSPLNKGYTLSTKHPICSLSALTTVKPKQPKPVVVLFNFTPTESSYRTQLKGSLKEPSPNITLLFRVYGLGFRVVINLKVAPVAAVSSLI